MPCRRTLSPNWRRAAHLRRCGAWRPICCPRSTRTCVQIALAPARTWGQGIRCKPTALVHEAYLAARSSCRSLRRRRRISCAAAALAMRHALINYAQARRVMDKGGGGRAQLTLSHVASSPIQSDEGLLALNSADSTAARARHAAPRRGRGDAASSAATARKIRRACSASRCAPRAAPNWLKARAWLFRELGGAAAPRQSGAYRRRRGKRSSSVADERASQAAHVPSANIMVGVPPMW